MGDVAKTLGVGPTIEFEGVEYRVAPLTYELQAKFERWLERQAIQSVQRLSGTLSREDYQNMLSGVARDIAAGVFSFGGEASVKSARSMPGLKELLRLSISKNHPEVDEQFIDRLVENQMSLANQALNEANADPLRPTLPMKKSGAS